MQHKLLPLAASAFVSLTHFACAGEEPRSADRFAMSPVEGGMLKLDKETGVVAFCARRGEAWSCEPVDDKAQPASERVARLEAENKDLKARIADLEERLKDSSSAPPPAAKLPSEEEVDKALDYAERLFKKFRDRIQKLEPPKPGDAPAEGGRL